MNRILFLLLIIISISNVQGQNISDKKKNFSDILNIDEDGYIIMPFNDDSTKIEYMQIVEVPNSTKEELLDLIQKWSISYFPFKKKALATTEILKDGIIVRTSFRVQIGNPSTDEKWLYFAIEFNVKDEKYKMTFKNFYLGKIDDNLENIYSIKKNRKPRQIVFKDVHNGIIKIKDSIVSSIKKTKEW